MCVCACVCACVCVWCPISYSMFIDRNPIRRQVHIKVGWRIVQDDATMLETVCVCVWVCVWEGIYKNSKIAILW